MKRHPKRTTLRRIILRPRPGTHTRGWLEAGPVRLPCAIGRSGTGFIKREGDGLTPRGTFALLQAFWRADQGRRPHTMLPLRRIRPQDGWCDAPADRNYNRRVPTPYPASHEQMWRQDNLYDLVIDIGWNRGPTAKGRGSAIFLHIAHGDFKPTAGCIALRPGDARRLLARLGPATRLVVV